MIKASTEVFLKLKGASNAIASLLFCCRSKFSLADSAEERREVFVVLEIIWIGNYPVNR